MGFKKIFVFTLILFVVCMGFSGASAAPKSGGILRYITTEAPQGSVGVPENMRGASSRYTKGIILEPLLIKIAATGKIEPFLAESYSWSDDMKNFTMKLRKGIKFHDGTDFNAEAVKWNWDRVSAAKAPGTIEVESLEVIDDLTLLFHLKKFDNTWLDHLAVVGQSQTGLMISPTAYKKNGKEWADWNPIGTGPFKFVKYTEDQSFEVIRFDDYWGQKPYLDGITKTIIKDFITAELAFEAGEGDMIMAVGHGRDLQNDLLPKGKGYHTLHVPGLTTVIIPPGARSNSPFSKQKVRQAVEYAIDKEAVVKSIYFGMADAKDIAVYEWQIPYDPDFKGRKYDPEKARQLLAEAGYPKGFKSTIYCQFLTCGTDSDAVQAYLKDVGIDCTIESVSVGKWIEMETNGWEDGLLMTFVGPESFPGQVARDWVEPDGPNWCCGLWYETLYRPEKLNELTKAYFSYGTIEEIREKGREIVQLLHDEAIVIPLWEHKDARILQPYLKTSQPDVYTNSLFFDSRLPQAFWLDK